MIFRGIKVAVTNNTTENLYRLYQNFYVSQFQKGYATANHNISNYAQVCHYRNEAVEVKEALHTVALRYILYYIIYILRFNKICHSNQRPRWQVDNEAICLSRAQQYSSTCNPPS